MSEILSFLQKIVAPIFSGWSVEHRRKKLGAESALIDWFESQSLVIHKLKNLVKKMCRDFRSEEELNNWLAELDSLNQELRKNIGSLDKVAVHEKDDAKLDIIESRTKYLSLLASCTEEIALHHRTHQIGRNTIARSDLVIEKMDTVIERVRHSTGTTEPSDSNKLSNSSENQPEGIGKEKELLGQLLDLKGSVESDKIEAANHLSQCTRTLTGDAQSLLVQITDFESPR